MVDWLVVWGATQAIGFAFKPILEELAADTAKDYAKDFFKNCLGKAVRLREKDALKEAYGRALKEFLELIQQELKLAGFSKSDIQKEYTKSLNIFLKNETVASILGDAFLLDRRTLNVAALMEIWELQKIPPLPSSFSWERVSKLYVEQVKEIIHESDKLRPIFSIKAEIANLNVLQEVAGVVKEFDLVSYAEGIKEQYGYLRLESLDPTSYEKLKLWNMFIPQNVRECRQFMPQIYEIPKKHLQRLRISGDVELAEMVEEELERRRREYFKQPLHPILEVVQREKGRKLVVLGDPGSGKSTLLQYLALDWAEKNQHELSLYPVPLLVELRTYARDKELKKCNDFLDFFHNGNVVCHLNRHSLHEKLQYGNVIALFDGLDEIFDNNLRNEVTTDIHRFSNAYPQVQIILTSRWLGYKAEKLINAEFQHFMLEELTEIQIKDFVRRWHELAFSEGADRIRKCERLQKAVSDSLAIRELASNPLLLTMMAILNRNQDLPRERPRLYERATEVLLHQWDVETKILEDPHLKKMVTCIDYQDKQAMLRRVAYHMQANEAGLKGNLVSDNDLKDILIYYLKSIEVSQAKAVADLMIQQLRVRNFILCFLGANSFAFVHRTFLEYFCAREFYERFKRRGLKDGLTLEELKNQVFGKHWHDKSWHEVLRLIAGMLSSEFPKEIARSIVDYLINQNSEEVNFANIFLASDCFSEFRNRNLFSDTSVELINHLREVFTVTSKWAWDEKLEVQKQVISKIATVWKDDLSAWDMLHSIALSKENSHISEDIAKSIAIFVKNRPEAFYLLQHLAETGNNKAIEALAMDWKMHPQTLPTLQQLAQNGHDGAVRSLIDSWRHSPETVLTLHRLAQELHHKLALEALCEYFSLDRTSMAILQDYFILQLSNSRIKINSLREKESVKILIEQIIIFIYGKSSDETKILLILERIQRPDLDIKDFFQVFSRDLRNIIRDDSARGILSEVGIKFFGVEPIGHFSTLRTKIADFEILKKSLQDLGITVKTNADVRGDQGRVRADIVAVLEGEYDLGWSRNADGTYDLIADLWGVAKKHNQTELINSINQKYAVNKTLADVISSR